MIAEGTYHTKACAELFFTPTKGGDYRVIVPLQIKGGPADGQKLDFRGSLKGGATEITVAALKIMGYDGNDPKSVMANEFEIVVAHESYRGDDGAEKKAHSVKYVNSLDRRSAYKQASEADKAIAKQKLDAAMAISFKGLAAVSTKDDDLVF